MAIATGSQVLAADVNGIGSGHLLIFPANYDSIGQGTWVNSVQASAVWQYYLANSTNADGDNLTYKLYMAIGTYTLRVIVTTAADEGVLDIDIDAAEIASHDLYSAGTVFNVVFTTTSIAVAAAGIKAIKLRLDGKHGSSSDHYARVISLAFWRTA